MGNRSISQLNAIGTSGIALLCIVLAVVMVCKSRSIVSLVASFGIASLAVALAALAVTMWPIPFKSCAVVNVRTSANQNIVDNAAYYAAVARKKTAEHCIPLALQIAGIMIPMGLVGLLTRGEIKGENNNIRSTDT